MGVTKQKGLIAHMNLIETRSLSKEYNKVLRVKELNMSVPEGAIYGFLGPNGAGKSTTLKMILGLVRPSSGEISVFGETATEKNRMELLKNVGSLIESPAYYGHLTAYENLSIVQLLRGAPRESVDEMLALVRLDGQRDKKASELSLGMKQRLGIAAALLGRPRLLILDEPTNGLDPAGIQEMRELIISLPRRYGMTVVVSSHLLSEIDQLATHVGVISRGELVYQDTLSSLHLRSEHHLALHTTDDEAACRALRERGLECTLREERILLPVLSDAETAAVTGGVAALGIGVLRLEERQKSLEDIFLQLTGGAASL